MPASTSRSRIPDSHHALPSGAIALRPTSPGARIELTLGVRRIAPVPDHAELDRLKPKDRHYLSRQDLLTRCGMDPAALARVRDFAKANHLTILREQPRAARVTLAGFAADAAAAFGVRLLDYEHPELGHFHARVGDLTVAAPLLAGDITGVFGFNNHRALRRKLQAMRGRKAPSPQATSRNWFLAPELAALYDFPPVTDQAMAGQTIGLLEFGGGVDETDANTYFQALNITAPTIVVVPVDGVNTDPASDPDSTGEVMLDVEVAGAMAPGAKIAVYFSTFDEKGMVDILAEVIEDQSGNDPSVLSISWGWDENQPLNGNTVPWSPSAMTHVNESFLAIANLGITVCVSTGDDGSEAQLQDGLAHVCFPSTSPYVLAVGGTTLQVHKAADGSQTVQERVWNDGPGDGTGGGISDYTPVPAWQEGITPVSINPGAFAGRGTPDVAANADPNTGYFVVSGGQQTVVGGTSAAAPLWASLVARLNASLPNRVGNFNALLYSQYGPGKVLRDIAEGNNDTDGLLNGQFAAVAGGWDACTGWGVPAGNALLAAMK